MAALFYKGKGDRHMGKILVVAEKPSVGKDIARILHCTREERGYVEGDNYVVTWALGHLVGLKQPQEHAEQYRTWKLEDLPFQFDISDSLKVLPDSAGQFKVVKQLINRPDIDSIINAGDAGREGYLIQKWIYRLSGNRKEEKVLWADDATEKTIQRCMQNLKDDSEFKNMLQEAEARAEGDYLIGMNYSRALTLCLAGKGTVLSFGRCQTPLLNMIVKRDAEIVNFKPVPYFNILLELENGITAAMMDGEGKTKAFFSREEAESIQRQLGTQARVVKRITEEKQEKAPLLHNLSSLQQKMGSRYRYAPDKTLEICQALYEKHKILSYPRTDSRYLTTSLYEEIGDHIKSCAFGRFRKWVEQIDMERIEPDKSYFNDHKVTDHHALIPTANPDMERIYGTLKEEEKNVFSEVVMRMLQIFFPAYIYDSTKLQLSADGCSFTFGVAGTTIKQPGYKELSWEETDSKKKEQEEVILPDVEEGDVLTVKKSFVQDNKTVPPKAYTVASIIKDMEKFNIGTSATRAEIIKKLMASNRQYITLENGKYHSTTLGRSYIRLIPDRLKEVEFTQKFETELQKVGAGEKTKAAFLQELADQTRSDISFFREQGKENGEKLQIDGTDEIYGKCPHCTADVRKGKYGFYCTGRCGMNLNTCFGRAYSENQLRKLLEGKKILMKGLKGKNGEYDAYLIPKGTEQYEYNGKTGYQFVFEKEYKQNKPKNLKK